MTAEALPTAPPPTGWTIADMEGLPEIGPRYELVDGVPRVMAPPKIKHQRALKRLDAIVEAAAPDEVIVMQAIGVVLAPDQCPVPDLVVVRTDDAEESWCVAADLVAMVAEVVSPSTRADDRFRKPAQYAQAGIPVYLRVELEPVHVIAYAVDEDGLYVETARAEPGQLLSLETPFPITLDPADLLR